MTNDTIQNLVQGYMFEMITLPLREKIRNEVKEQYVRENISYDNLLVDFLFEDKDARACLITGQRPLRIGIAIRDSSQRIRVDMVNDPNKDYMLETEFDRMNDEMWYTR